MPISQGIHHKGYEDRFLVLGLPSPFLYWFVGGKWRRV